MDPKNINNILQLVGIVVWENVMILVDVKLVRMEHDYQTVIEVSKHLNLDENHARLNQEVFDQ